MKAKASILGRLGDVTNPGTRLTSGTQDPQFLILTKWFPRSSPLRSSLYLELHTSARRRKVDNALGSD